MVADDPDDGDGIFSDGDTLSLVFAEPTNGPTFGSPGAIDAAFAFSQPIGTVYVAAWNGDKSVLTITIVNGTGTTAL